MNPIRRVRLQLRPFVVALFVLLTVPIFVAIIAVVFVSNQRTARANADAMIDRFHGETIDSIENLFGPIKSLIRSAGVVGTREPDFYSHDRSFEYLLSLLLHDDKLVSIYVGLDNGMFRQARRIEPAVEIQGKLPPAGVAYAYRLIPPDVSPRIDHYLFLDKELASLGTSEQENSYDPRQRLWYRQTAEDRTLNLTDPVVFATLGLIGFTIATPIYDGGRVVGVAAADLTLAGLSEFLSERKISPGTLSYILDSQDGVLANSEKIKTWADKSGEVSLLHIAALADPLPGIAFGARPREDGKSYAVKYGGKEYVANLATLPPHFGKSWQIFTITPLADFSNIFERNNRMMVFWGMVALAAEILIISLMSAAISRPLERLAMKVTRIEELERNDTPPLHSAIGEISVLSRAIDTLGASLEARKQRRDEMQAAAAIQNSILPRPLAADGALAAVDLYAEMHPAREIGGDFYDFYPVEGDRLAITVADVSGKGIPAALFMAVSRTVLRSGERGGDMAADMEDANRVLSAENASAMFVTAFHGILDLASGLLRYCNAGHNPPYLLRASGESETLKATGIPFGIDGDMPYRIAETRLSPGDTLFLFSDGITEAFSREGEEFGNARLEAALEAARGKNAAELVCDVLAATTRFAAGAEQSDDITLLALVYRAPELGLSVSADATVRELAPP